MILHDRDGGKRCDIADPAKSLLMSAKQYRLYLASMVNSADTGNDSKGVLLRLASEQTENGIINAEAELLKRIKAKSDEIEEIVRSRGDPPVHYDWLVPQLEATFITEKSQDGRQANLLSFSDVATKELFPLPKLQEYCMIDCKTAAWILGRYFKLQTFLDVLREPVILDPNQVLMLPSKHRLIYIGFVSMPPAGNYAPKAAQLHERNITTVARNILDWIEPDQLLMEPGFDELIQDFAAHGRQDGARAHKDLYGWIDEHWGVAYHPFTYFVKSEGVWKHDNTPIF